MPTAETALPLRVGARTLWTIRRRLLRRRVTLAEALDDTLQDLPALGLDDQGYLVTGVPESQADRLAEAHPGLKAFVRLSYPRSYARLDLGFDSYLTGFSGRSRSTLKRKTRRLAERCGGALDVRMFRTEAEMEKFHRDARAVSSLTYQERLLDAGLPDGEEAIAGMRRLARRDEARGWLLFVDGRPAAYLYAPAEGDTLLYAHLGYDPQFSDLSPGTVLQLEAMRMAMAEARFRLFDFTEGDGQHKRLFATGSVDSLDLLLVRPTLANLVAGHGLAWFDGAVAIAREAARSVGLRPRLRG